EWGKKDPVQRFEEYLLEHEVLNHFLIKEIKEKIKAEIDAGVQKGFVAPAIEPDTKEEIADLYAPFDNAAIAPATEAKSEKKFIQAISDGLRQSMQKHPNLVLMGQDIAEYGGAFKVTEGFIEEFGKGR